MAARIVGIAVSLARRTWARAAGAALFVAGLLAGSLPLLDQPGYELGEALSLLAALLAPFLAVAALREESARPDPSPLAAWAAASLALLALLALPALGAFLRAAAGPCSALSAAAWFVPALAVPSALLGTALAVAAALAAGGRRALAATLYALLASASLALSLRRAYQGAAAFAFDPLLGAWPGPLYDEALAVDLRAALFRAGALAWAVAIAALAESLARSRRAGPRAALRPALLACAAAGAALLLASARTALALSGEADAVAGALGGRREGPRCTVSFPSEKPPAAAAALLAECEFQQADVARALGIAEPPHVTLFAYRSAEEKRRLVGAAGTEYSKPWLGQIHVLDQPLPHPALRHEMVHAVAAAAAGGPLRVPARAGVLVSAGLVDGLAAAIETPRGAWTVHGWSRAARDLGLLPDVRRILGPAGFWREPPARAYAAAGSFLRFLLDTRGAAKVREAYRTGDIDRALGAPLGALAAEWERFLGGVEVPPGLAAAARARLSRGSIFARRCAREVAAVEAAGARASASGRAAEACAAFERAAALSGRPEDLLHAGDALARAGDLDGAGRAVRSAADLAADGEALRAAIGAAEGDLAWRRGDPAAATASWSSALAARPDRAEARLLQAKLAAAADPVLGPASRAYLLAEGDPAASLARVALVDRPLAAYLVGRALLARAEPAAAAAELSRAAKGPLPDLLAREAALLLGEARCASGEAALGEAELRSLAGRATAAERERIDEALRRCGWEGSRGGPRGP